MLWRIFPALLLLLLSGCETPTGLVPLDDDDVGDDDDSTGASDDDDSVQPPPTPEVATFAWQLDGEVNDELAPGYAGTELVGQVQILYWEDTEGSPPICRQRIPIQAWAGFGPLGNAPCAGCAGLLTVQDASPPLEDVDDACPPGLLGENDLSFLVRGGDEQGDLGQVALVGLGDAANLDWNLGIDSVDLGEVIATYAEAGLQSTYLGLVRADGWLSEEADLASIANGDLMPGWLPAFIAYRDADRPDDGLYLDGDTWFASLWRLGLLSFEESGGPPLPTGDAD